MRTELAAKIDGMGKAKCYLGSSLDGIRFDNVSEERWEPDKRCKECGKKLSQYNHADKCFLHQKRIMPRTGKDGEWT